jgi:hypothetical protein
VTKIEYYIEERCMNMTGSKNARKPNEKKKVLYNIYQRTKVQKLGNPKNERAKKTSLTI